MASEATRKALRTSTGPLCFRSRDNLRPPRALPRALPRRSLNREFRVGAVQRVVLHLHQWHRVSRGEHGISPIIIIVHVDVETYLLSYLMKD